MNADFMETKQFQVPGGLDFIPDFNAVAWQLPPGVIGLLGAHWNGTARVDIELVN